MNAPPMISPGMSMPRLLVDIGNTRLKWRWHSGAGPDAATMDAATMETATGAVPLAALRDSPEPLHEQLRGLWRAEVPLAEPGLALIACVAEEPMATAAREAAARLGFQPHRVTTAAEAAGVRNGYAQPERLGVDRWLGLIAAQAMGSGEGAANPTAATVIAGVGTALTLDVLAADGTHRGGLLVPGPELMQQTLLERTARIASSAGTDAPAIEAGLGRNTAGALQAGAWLAAAAVTERLMREAGAERLVLTGGGAEAVAAQLRPGEGWQVRLMPHLVLQGLDRLADALLRGETVCGIIA